MNPALAKALVRAVLKIMELLGRAKWYQEGRDAILAEQRRNEEETLRRADAARARPIDERLRDKYTRD